MSTDRHHDPHRRWPWALALLVLSPVCAEYLWGYDDTTGDALVLLGGLLIFSPLYGAPALLIREAAIRLGLRWPGILLLAAAAGLIEAGLVDQSMFSINYRDIPYWDDITVPTAIGPLGLSVYTALTFVGGHVVLSFGAPIALVEGLSGEARSRPWLGRVGLVITALFYAAACALVLGDQLSSESDHASPTQLLLTSVVVALLVAAAVATKRRRPARVAGAVPASWLVGLGVLAAASTYTFLPPSRLGTTALGLVAIAVTAVLVRLSLRDGWTQAHTVAAAGGALVAAGFCAFWTDPLGDVPAFAKYAHNVVLIALVAGLSMWAMKPTRPAATPPVSPSVSW